jgi:beta-mannosidase
MAGRFISEFGMPSLPDIRTVEYWHGDDTSPRHPQSKMMQQHNKAGSHERRFAIAMNENFRYSGDLESYVPFSPLLSVKVEAHDRYVYLTQLMQSEAVGSAYSTWRRNWKGPNREYSAGAIVWQLNDTWPVTSWAIIDYFVRSPPL